MRCFAGPQLWSRTQRVHPSLTLLLTRTLRSTCFQATKNYSQKEETVPLVVSRQWPNMCRTLRTIWSLPRGVNPRTYKPLRQSPISSVRFDATRRRWSLRAKRTPLYLHLSTHTRHFMTEDSPDSLSRLFPQRWSSYQLGTDRPHPYHRRLYPRSWILEASQDGNRWISYAPIATRSL